MFNLFIMVLFHVSAYKDFKHFWLDGMTQDFRDCFRALPSRGRFVSLMPRPQSRMGLEYGPKFRLSIIKEWEVARQWHSLSLVRI